MDVLRWSDIHESYVLKVWSRSKTRRVEGAMKGKRWGKERKQAKVGDEWKRQWRGRVEGGGWKVEWVRK